MQFNSQTLHRFQALQKTRGNFEGGSAVSASAVLKLTANSSLEDLKQRIHQSLRSPPERQLLLQLPDVSPSGFTSWLVPVRSPLASLLPHAQLRGTEMIPTVLLMFLSNDADLESLPSMLQWPMEPMEPVESAAGVPRQLLPMMPLLCNLQTKQTVSFYPCQSEDFSTFKNRWNWENPRNHMASLGHPCACQVNISMQKP